MIYIHLVRVPEELRYLVRDDRGGDTTILLPEPAVKIRDMRVHDVHRFGRRKDLFAVVHHLVLEPGFRESVVDLGADRVGPPRKGQTDAYQPLAARTG